ncbi:MAG: hypothetical protein ABL994_05275 [Verrucomicrobiales bacterium]
MIRRVIPSNQGIRSRYAASGDIIWLHGTDRRDARESSPEARAQEYLESTREPESGRFVSTKRRRHSARDRVVLNSWQ